jgi:hypothetical protein
MRTSLFFLPLILLLAFPSASSACEVSKSIDWKDMYKLITSNQIALPDNLCGNEECVLDWQCESFNCNTKIKNKPKNYVGLCEKPFYKASWFIITVISLVLVFIGLIALFVCQYKKNLQMKLN